MIKVVVNPTSRETKTILEFKINIGNYLYFIDEIISLAKQRISSFICVANVHMFVEAYKDRKLLGIVNSADLVTPDGRPLVWALRLLYGIKQDRVCGMDMVPDLFNRIVLEQLPVYFVGGSEELLERTEDYLRSNYPSMQLAGMYSPPYRDLTENENIDLINAINHSEAAIVFFVLGCPKQEKLMGFMKGKVNAAMVGIGGALAVTVGEKRRAPVWMQNYGFEWLFRFFQEPKRLFKRYTSTNFFFLYLIIKEVINVRLLSSKDNKRRS